MMYLMAVGLALSGLALREGRALKRHKLVEVRHRLPGGLLKQELRRRTYMDTTIPDSFPQPREERVVAWRLLHVPFFHQSSIVALPASTDTRIDAIEAHEFDAHFSASFRLGDLPELAMASLLH